MEVRNNMNTLLEKGNERLLILLSVEAVIHLATDEKRRVGEGLKGPLTMGWDIRVAKVYKGLLRV